jgi:mono/diheme cytochrome c family protein
MDKTAWLNIFGILLVGLIGLQLPPMADMNARASSSSSNKSAQMKGDAERGREIFNGKGVCYYCHGTDGYRDKLPQLETDTAAVITRLNPSPTDLRNPKALHLNTDKQRFRVIREGHTGTGMFPDTTMTDQDVMDTLAYLAVLREEGHARQR